MKIADKIKLAVALNPKIDENRAKLRALYYIHKHNPKNMFFTMIDGYAYTDISLHQIHQKWEVEIGKVTMTPLTNYNPTTLEAFAEKSISGLMGVSLDCVKKVLDKLGESDKV